MKNEYIEVVKRWLAGEEVSVEELRANAEAAADAADAARAADAAAYAAEYAAEVAYVAAAHAARDADNVDYWVKRYEELTNE